MLISDSKLSEVTNKIDCHPDPGATIQKCMEKGCCWKKDQKPWCFQPNKGNSNIMGGKPKLVQHIFLIGTI